MIHEVILGNGLASQSQDIFVVTIRPSELFENTYFPLRRGFGWEEEIQINKIVKFIIFASLSHNLKILLNELKCFQFTTKSFQFALRCHSAGQQNILI